MEKKEQELRREISRLEAVIDTFPFDLWCKDLEGRYIFVNKSFEEYTGKPREEILGKNDYELYPKEEADA
ncbi:MAG: PAS domain-containing protein, partial [Bacillota bacterium]